MAVRESLESRRVWDRADLIMIIGIHQLQITLMERDFSDQEHIFDCRSKFTFSFFFFFYGTSYYATLRLCSQQARVQNVLLALPLEATFTDVRGELQPLHLFPPPVSNWLP